VKYWNDVVPASDTAVQTITVDATEQFKKYALVATKAAGNSSNVAIQDWQLFTESFSIDGGKVAMAQQAATGGETVMDQSGPHSRLPKTAPLKKYPEIAFEEGKFDRNDSTNTYKQAGYVARVSSSITSGEAYRAFDGSTNTFWHTQYPYYTENGGVYDPGNTAEGTGTPSGTLPSHELVSGYAGEYITLSLPNKIKMSKISINTRADLGAYNLDQTQSAEVIVVVGSHDGSTWEFVDTHTVGKYPDDNTAPYTFNVNTSTYYEHVGLICTNTGPTVSLYNTAWSMSKLAFFGYEEDPPAGDTSVDTTFTSIMNTPQTTGAKVYTDAKLSSDFTNRVVGPSVSNAHTTYVSAEKYWELSGNVESNVTIEANTFLSGDQPHAVSVWFNSSNLEANVSNTCVFSVSDQEHLNSENLDLQSNTWHNLTYAYQGEGGSRVTYLDGRKVAEDQAEDTFGEYPPFAMTGYSQGGYVVSTSNEYDEGVGNLQLLSWMAFDNTAGTRWDTANDGNYNSSGIHNGSVTTEVDGTPESGEWIQLEFPHKLRPSHFTLNTNIGTGGSYNYQERAPKTVLLVGSNTNNGTDWVSLFNNTSTPRGSTPSITLVEPFTVSSTNCYKYFRLIVLTTFGGTSGSSASITELQFYGHRENDLVRLPDPTRVLKYPHIAMTGPAQRGYVVSVSSEYNNTVLEYRVFDGSYTNAGAWISGADGYDTNGIADNGNGDDFLSGIVGVGSENGAWIKLQMPHKIVLSYLNFYVRDPSSGYHRQPKSGYIYGSNDDSSFDRIGTFTRTTTTAAGTPIAVNINATTAYKYIVFQVTATITGGTEWDAVIVDEIELYGTGVDSIPIQIGGGNIDKVANFRVYDKFVGEDQALEIWDAQKDAFGRAKSSMTLHKGRLGIGTTEPEGRLAVLDEPHNLEEFPPRAMTGYKTYFEGHGEFCVRSSFMEDPFNTTGSAGGLGKLFDKGMPPGTEDTHFYRGVNNVFDVDGYYTGSDSIGGIMGDWVRIDFPYRAKIQSMNILTRSDEYNGRAPRDGYLLGRNNDEDEWTIIHEWTGALYYQFIERKFTIEASKYYSSYALVATRLLSAAETGTNSTSTSRLNIGEWRLFGTREQGQSVLHDGQLTLTKSLNVPRIGPALDADDTPRRDRLVVEYNTSTNPTFDGAVRDTSGGGNDGVFYGEASYDATEKAITLSDGTDDYVESGKTIIARGTPQHTFSFWLKPSTGDHDDTGTHYLVVWGSETAQNKWSGVALTNDGALAHVYHSSGKFTVDKVLPSPGTWYHVAIVVKSTSATTAANRDVDFYIDGIQYSNTYDTLGSNPTNAAYYLDWGPGTHTSVRLGSLHSSSADSSSSLSTIKLYDCALTAEEVKTLYDMGQCDEGHHVVNFSKTRVGIGLGDGEAPTYTLDVRGQIRSQGSLVTSFTGQHKCVPEEPVEKGLIVSAKKNQYVKLNGSLDTGKSAITIDESLPIVSLSNVVQDKACFGVVSSTEEANTVYRVETTNGGVISYIPKTLGDNRAIVNSVGEGAIWVVNTNGSLESGDYITTSNVAGYGQKQEDDVLHNYTVAKITMDCDFTGSNVAVQTIKREETGLRTITEDVWNDLIDYDRSSNTETQYSNTLVPSAYSGQSGYTPREVTTIVDYTDGSNLISIAEWSNLESNIQNTYQSNTFTEIADYTKFISLDEWSNLTVDVQNTYSEAEITTYYQIKRGENVLDENGQLQFEDKTGATEAPYERRFLDASGAQTDEANAVHIAAFVGCTYHCG
jgi:hypothetical protein